MASFRCTFGCPTPWKAPHPSPRSFTRPPWSPPAFISSRAFIRSCRASARIRHQAGTTVALTVVTWVGAATAVFAALIAVAQNDIKRILAYSTVSQLGYMMAGLGMGGVAVGMFHLITHAFFKALLFLGAGSVIHGCHEEQDIRRMGGLKVDMPLTFITYTIGMLALCGFPIFFSGFWSKDGILEAAQHWSVAKGPFYMLVFGALLTAFYMTRQVCYVFLGYWRGHETAHESPKIMTVPLAILAFFAMALGLVGTPAWPWFRALIEGRAATFGWRGFAEPGLGLLMLTSSLVVFLGLGLGWRLYGDKSPKPEEPDALEKSVPWLWGPASRSPLRRRVLRCHSDCLL